MPHCGGAGGLLAWSSLTTCPLISSTLEGIIGLHSLPISPRRKTAVVPRIADKIGGQGRVASTEPANVRNWDIATIAPIDAKQRKQTTACPSSERPLQHHSMAAVPSTAESRRSSAWGRFRSCKLCGVLQREATEVTTPLPFAAYWPQLSSSATACCTIIRR